MKICNVNTVIISLILSIAFLSYSTSNTNAQQEFEVLRIGNGVPTCMTWEPQGDFLAVGGSLGIWIYNPTFEKTVFLEGHKRSVTTVAWSPNGNSLASGDEEGVIRIWNTSTWQTDAILEYPQAGRISYISWSPDSQLLASANYGDVNQNRINIWDTSTSTIYSSYQSSGRVQSLSWSPDAGKLASGGSDNTLYVTDIKTLNITSFPNTNTTSGRITSVAWNPRGNQIATSHWLNNEPDAVYIWDVSTKSIKNSMQVDFPNFVIWNTGGTRLTVVGQNVQIWDPSKGNNIVQVANSLSFEPISAAWRPSTDELAILDYSRVNIWETTTYSIRASGPVYSRPITDVAWSPDGSLIAGVSENVVSIWDTTDGNLVKTLTSNDSNILSISWSPDGSKLASVDGFSMQIWEVSTGQLHANLTGVANFTSVAWSPTGNQLAASDETANVFVWNLTNMENVHMFSAEAILPEDYFGPTMVAWHPDGTTIAVATWIGTIILWDATDGQPLGTLNGWGDMYNALSIAWSSTGERLAGVGSNNSSQTHKAWIIDIDSGELLTTLAYHTRPIYSVAWNPNDQQLATAGDDTEIIVWNLQSFQPETILEGHTERVTSLSWNPKGDLLVSGSLDGTVRIWQSQ